MLTGLITHVVVLQLLSCVQLLDLMDCRPADSSIHGTSQAKILEWVAIPFSRGSSCVESMSRILDTGDQTHVSFTGRQNLYH